jgi:hypothetical protein
MTDDFPPTSANVGQAEAPSANPPAAAELALRKARLEWPFGSDSIALIYESNFRSKISPTTVGFALPLLNFIT